jgi:erythromycin esterase-like protein
MRERYHLHPLPTEIVDLAPHYRGFDYMVRQRYRGHQIQPRARSSTRCRKAVLPAWLIEQHGFSIVAIEADWPDASRVDRYVRHRCQHLPPPERATEFGGFFDRFGNGRVVLLGEATHGTADFYNARAAITRRGRRTYDDECFARFPTWMWRNEEVREFVEWLRAHNEAVTASSSGDWMSIHCVARSPRS